MSTGGFRKVGVEFIGDDSSLDAAWARQGAAAKDFATVSTEANAKATTALVASTTKQIRSLEARTVAFKEAAAAASAGSKEQAALSVKAAASQARLDTALGLSTTNFGRTGKAAATADRDIGKLVRGAAAGSGVISGLGRSLAFASGGFIAVAGGATLLHNAIQAALDLAATQRQVDAQLKTSGGSWKQYGAQIDAADQKISHLSGFTNQELLQSFNYLLRVSGNVDQSLKLNAIAADVARGRHIALSSASIALAKALGGSSTALRRLGIIVPKTAEGMDAINYVAKKFAGQAEAGATSADRLNAAFVNAEEIIGTALLPTFTRLTTHLNEYLSNLERTGRLQRDANEAVKIAGTVFHALEGIVRHVDDATGSFAHTVEILIALDLAKKAATWITQLRILAETWGLVGTSAAKAGASQAAALSETRAAGAGSSAVGGAGGLLAGGALGAIFSRLRYGKGGLPSRIGEYTGAGAGGEAAVGAEAGLSSTAVGALAVAAVLATQALDDLAKTTGDKLGAGSNYNKGVDALAGFLSGGLVGNSAFSPLHSIFGAIFHGQVPFSSALQRTFGSPTPTFTPQGQLLSQLGLTNAQLFGPVPGSIGAPFGLAKPMEQFWKTFTLSLRDQMAQAQAALTKSNADDIAEARKEVAQIKRLLDEGRLKGPALLQALGLEASALNTIWSGEAALAQKRAAAAAAEKQKIAAEFQNLLDPLSEEVALSRAQAFGKSTIPALRALLASARKALASAKSLAEEKQALDQIASLNSQLKSAETTATVTFIASSKLQLALAKDSALGLSDTSDLLKLRKAILKFIATHKKNTAALIDAYNQLAQVNQQLGASAQDALGLFKQASTRALTAGLGLTAAQRKALRARLSRLGPGGTLPGDGTGAYGYAISGSGRPIHVHTHISIDGKPVADNTTRHQQRSRRRQSRQRRGPHAGS